jgi:N-acetyl sugar amidotransferase
MHNKEAFYGLPKEVQFCKRCVISNQRPNSTVEFKSNVKEKKEVIDFDEEGICSACRYNDEKEVNIDWKMREETLWKLCDKFRSKDGSYDVIIPGSGGKDSAYTSHILKYKYGMNPLTVTWAPHLYTDIGWKNFSEWMREGGLDNILYTPNGKLHRLLTKLAFHNLLHPFQPFIIGQRIIGPAMAARYGVKLVMYGENQAEYGNKVDENNIPTMDTKFFSVDDPMEMSLGGIAMKDIIKDYGFSKADFAPYIPVGQEELTKKNVEVHYLGYYLKWDPQECYYYAVENTGFSANTERTEGSYSKYSSIDDKIDPFHYFTTLIKFGIGRATYDAAQEVRNGKITREEGMILAKKFDQEFPHKFYKEFLEYIDTNDEEFKQTIDRFRSPHLWGKDADGKWKLRHTVSLDGLDDMY